MFSRLEFSQEFAGSFLSPFYVDGKEIDERQFLMSASANPELRISVGCEENCRLHDLNFAASDLLVCKRGPAETLAKLCGDAIQLVPITLSGSNAVGVDLFLVILLDHVDCIDIERSQYTRWTSIDHRGDLAGKFRMMMKLVVDEKRARGHIFFRPVGWEIAMIADRKVVEELTLKKFTGVTFKEV